MSVVFRMCKVQCVQSETIVKSSVCVWGCHCQHWECERGVHMFLRIIIQANTRLKLGRRESKVSGRLAVMMMIGCTALDMIISSHLGAS